MRFLTKFLVLFFLFLPVSAWAAGSCPVKANGDFSVTATIADYDSTQIYDLVVEPRGNSGSDIKIWSNQYDPNDPALINPNNTDLPLVDGESYQMRFNYVAETTNEGTLTYYIKQGNSQYWTELNSVPLTIANNSNNDVTVSGDATVECSESVPETPVLPDAPNLDFCRYVPEPVQSWKSGSVLDITNAKTSNSTPYYHIGGWSDSYVDTYTHSKEWGDGPNGGGEYPMLSVPFDVAQGSGVDNGGWTYTASCQAGGCTVAPDGEPVPPKVEAPPPVEPNFESTIDLVLASYGGDNNFDVACPTDGSVSYCQSSIDSSGVRTVTIKEDLRSLNVSGGRTGDATSDQVIVILQPNPEDEDYGRKIETLTLGNGSVKLQFNDNGIYSFNDIISNTADKEIEINGQTIIKSVAGVHFNNPVKLTTLAKPEYFVIYSPEGELNFSSNFVKYYGYFIADTVTFPNGTYLIGGIAANHLTITQVESTVFGYGACQDFNPTPNESYQIDVTPDQGYYLTCDAPEVTFTVRNENGEIATSYTGDINATFPTGLVPNNSNLQQGTVVDTDNNVYSPSQGQVIVPVSATEYTQYTVAAELAEDSSQSDTGSIEFVPFAFYTEDQYVIADKPKDVTVKALACDSETHDQVAISYTGTPTISSSLQVPSNGVGDLTFDPDFSGDNNGETNTDLTFDNSGIVNVTLEDSDFDCTGLDDCPIEGGGVLKGSFVVKSRPWTFAICDENGGSNLPNGNSESGEKFVAAGDIFGLQVKPIVWQQGGSETEPVEVSGYCGADVTTNFFLTDAPEATLALDSELATPTAGNPDVVMVSASTLQREHTEKSSGNYYAYSDLSWQEVGSLKVTADALDPYLDMTINQGYREIGRFYPHHFKLENDNEWDYAVGHDGFAYMNQPIPMDYTVKAKSATDSDTENYGDFADSLKAAFVLEAREIESVFGTVEEGESLTGRIDTGDNQASGNWNKASYQFISNDFALLKNSSTESGYTSTPDGPYNSSNAVFGVAVDDSPSAQYANEDKVNFDEDFSDTDIFTAQHGLDDIAVAFFSQPDFRYGRMVLDAVSGPIGGPISVPLRVEYWDDSNFIVNEDDNGSQFKTDIYYVMSNVSGSSATLTSDNSSSFVTVSNGRSSQVKAKQETSTRETVRLFLRQGNESDGFANNPEPKEDDDLNETVEGWSNAEDVGQPWLQFNWRDKGDEDPSTVVNFGAYRGNDRIIYRGEPNLTGE